VKFPELHRLNVAEANAKIAAAGRCFWHNTGIDIPPVGFARWANGNEIPLCGPCLDWLNGPDADPDSRPVATWQIGPNTTVPTADGYCGGEDCCCHFPSAGRDGGQTT
jgi:hypothetical protein